MAFHEGVECILMQILQSRERGKSRMGLVEHEGRRHQGNHRCKEIQQTHALAVLSVQLGLSIARQMDRERRIEGLDWLVLYSELFPRNYSVINGVEQSQSEEMDERQDGYKYESIHDRRF